ncbi:hypothetical protein [Undibacterium pigrum]|uniref:Uncharacterized protein n=1 Tax=Undibacterium pigrum TaxID=401470 RepID=A0A318J5X2_9BURK|nr:hypothetical protein [Undibacterium pigrum]PXX42102.1 hypothetical protein DFR42_106282 [Undibacterium pigrum]
MDNIGPILETLTHRLANIPPDFLDEPRMAKNNKGVAVAALVNDVMRMLGNATPLDNLERFDGMDAGKDRNRLALTMITTWLLADEWFIRAALPAAQFMSILEQTVAELAAATAAHKFTSDPDRREELARVVLARLNYRPEGESLAQATDRLSSISGMERRRLVEASRAAEQRARAIREALAKKAAEESADKWTRE